MVILIAAAARAAEVAPRTDSLGREYYVYEPPRIDKSKTYWLVVGVHAWGGDGKGAAGLSVWANRGDCIVVGPSFPNDGYQGLGQRAGEQLELLFKDLRKQYRLHDQMFLYGFSGGAQFAHRFMMAYPELVAGCSAHSAGSWATGGRWQSINPRAADIPLVISCGQADTAKSTPDAPYTRIEWARVFEKELAEGKFLFQAGYWPNTGHAPSRGVARMTSDCYQLATRIEPARRAAIAAIRPAVAGRQTAKARQLLTQARRLAAKGESVLDEKAAGRFREELNALGKEM